MDGHGFPKPRVDEIVLAVDEACTNAIRHAYANCPDRRFRLTLRANGGCVEVTLRDRGKPAPAGRLKRKDPIAPGLDALKPGGLGVQLMYEVFDEVKFRPGRERGNAVTMRLERPSS